MLWLRAFWEIDHFLVHIWAQTQRIGVKFNWFSRFMIIFRLQSLFSWVKISIYSSQLSNITFSFHCRNILSSQTFSIIGQYRKHAFVWSLYFNFHLWFASLLYLLLEFCQSQLLNQIGHIFAPVTDSLPHFCNHSLLHIEIILARFEHLQKFFCL